VHVIPPNEQKDVRPKGYHKESDINLYRIEQRVRRLKNKKCSSQKEELVLSFFRNLSYNREEIINYHTKECQ